MFYISVRLDDPVKIILILFTVQNLQGITYDTGGADVKVGGGMIGMCRDKCGAASVAGFFKVSSIVYLMIFKLVIINWGTDVSHLGKFIHKLITYKPKACANDEQCS